MIKTDLDLVQYFRKYNEWDLLKLLVKFFKKIGNRGRKEEIN